MKRRLTVGPISPPGKTVRSLKLTLPSAPNSTAVDERVPYFDDTISAGDSTRSSSAPTPVSGSSLSAAGSQNEAQTRFQTLVGELSPISFDTSIFTDVRFKSLVDLTTPIAPKPSGRSDPFAPIPSVQVDFFLQIRHALFESVSNPLQGGIIC